MCNSSFCTRLVPSVSIMEFCTHGCISRGSSWTCFTLRSLYFKCTIQGAGNCLGCSPSAHQCYSRSHEKHRGLGSVRFRIEFKILLLLFKALNGSAPQHLAALLHFQIPARALRSFDQLPAFFCPFLIFKPLNNV